MIFIYLTALVALILWLDTQPFTRVVTRYLPTPFWCYFIPMIFSSLGLFPTKSPVYQFFGSYVLGACLLLLLLNIHLPAILKLGKVATGAMLVGAFGIALGAIISFQLFHSHFPPEFWKAMGILSASWIGGSANMLMVKEALNASESIFTPLIVVDTIVAYSWMALLVLLSAFQTRWDTWRAVDRKSMDAVSERLRTESLERPVQKVHGVRLILSGIGLLAGALGIVFLITQVIAHMPTTGVFSFLSPTGWILIATTLLGIALSLTPISKLESYGASTWGTWCLYLLLASLGAKARLQDIAAAPLVLGVAAVWVSIHAVCLAAYGYWKRIPLFFLVTSSQANIGGVASTPIVAGVYEKSLVSVGLLLAIFGNILGSYAGIGIAYICKWLAYSTSPL